MNISSYKKVISIDPDIDMSGICFYDAESKHAEITTLPMWELFDVLNAHRSDLMLLENGNLSKSNWHGRNAAKNVGKGNGVAKVISEFLKQNKFNLIELKPQGFSHFKTNESFIRATGLNLKSSNNEERSALCIILKFFKIKTVCKKKLRELPTHAKGDGMGFLLR